MKCRSFANPPERESVRDRWQLWWGGFGIWGAMHKITLRTVIQKLATLVSLGGYGSCVLPLCDVIVRDRISLLLPEACSGGAKHTLEKHVVKCALSFYCWGGLFCETFVADRATTGKSTGKTKKTTTSIPSPFVTINITTNDKENDNDNDDV